MSFTISLSAEDEKVDFEEFFSYASEMMLFQRLLQRENTPAMATEITALWMWFQTEGYGEKLTLKIVENDDEEFFNSLAVESMAMLAILDPSTETPCSPDLFPSIATLISPNLEVLSEIINGSKDTVSQEVEKLCKVLIVSAFNDFEKRNRHTHEPENGGADGEEKELKEGELKEKEAEEENPNEVEDSGEKGSEEENNPNEVEDNGERASGEEDNSIMPFALNPNAEEWRPSEAPEENRCVFLTFSNGRPLTEREIITFFTRKYGPCIQRVYIHHPENSTRPPLFGKVIFKAVSIVAMVLGGEEEAKFVINRRPLWCKKYQSRRARAAAAAQQEN